MSVKLLTASSGSVTLSPEDTASDVVLTVPATAGEILNDASDIEAQVKTATNATGTAPIYACRSWVNFNGTGTVAINASGNVSSITDNGTGDYTVNFTTAMPDTNYAVNVTSGTSAGGQGFIAFQDFRTTANTTNLFRIVTTTTSTATDVAKVYVSVFR